MTEDRSTNPDETTESRRWWLKFLIGFTIGIPIAIEGLTALGMLSASLFGNNKQTDTPTSTRRFVGIGDEVLPSTPQSEILREAGIYITDSDWLCQITIEVRNSHPRPYSFTIGNLVTSDGTIIEGGKQTGQIQSGSTDKITLTWDLPKGETPKAIYVTATIYDSQNPQVINKLVYLEDIPVRG
ncbi:MAG: hypothetical protein ABEI86_06380 [Halobacteriaceae archaeon]